MDKIIWAKIDGMQAKHKCEHSDYEYFKKTVVPRRDGGGCTVNVYEIPPKKSAYPYHYHTQNEEVFYVVSGEGVVRTPDGDKSVSCGDIIFFPANECGAHKITNVSDSEKLVYIDFDTAHDIDASIYPDSGKIGIWGKDINKVFNTDDAVDYYYGE